MNNLGTLSEYHIPGTTDIAHLVERHIPNVKVAGSNPAINYNLGPFARQRAAPKKTNEDFVDDDTRLVADLKALENALRGLVKFIDPKPPGASPFRGNQQQAEELSVLLKEAYRCLWSAHPGEGR